MATPGLKTALHTHRRCLRTSCRTTLNLGEPVFGRAAFSLHYIANRKQQCAGESALHNATAATSELAPFMHCFDCSPFQTISRSILNCSPVNVNDAVNTSAPALARCFAEGIISDARSGAQSIFQGTETDTVLSVCIISAPHPSASCCSPTAGEHPATACGTSPSTCVCSGQAALRQFASDCFPFSLGEFKLGCGKGGGAGWLN